MICIVYLDQELLMNGIQQELLVLSTKHTADENKMARINVQNRQFEELKKKLSGDRELRDHNRMIMGDISAIAPKLKFKGFPRGTLTTNPNPYVSIIGVGNAPSYIEGKMIEIDVNNASRNAQDRWMVLHAVHGITSKFHDKLLMGIPAENIKKKIVGKYVRIHRDKDENIVCARVTAKVLWNYAHTYLAERTPKNYKTATGITMEEFIKCRSFFDIMQCLSAEPFSCNQHSLYQVYLFTIGRGICSEEFVVVLKMSMMKKFGEIIMERQFKEYYKAICLYFNQKELNGLGWVSFIVHFKKRVRLNRMRKKIKFASGSMVGGIQTAYISWADCEKADEDLTEEFLRMDDEDVEDFYGFCTF